MIIGHFSYAIALIFRAVTLRTKKVLVGDGLCRWTDIILTRGNLQWKNKLLSDQQHKLVQSAEYKDGEMAGKELITYQT
jgi:hypothetical protein